MQTRLKVSFQGCTPSDALRQLIVEQAETLERFNGRLISCHVVVKVPDRHHRTGGLYDVSIHVVMPGGKEVDIDHTPTLDERFADPQFAVSDAFRRARRLIKDRVRQLRGEVKTLRKRVERGLDEAPAAKRPA